MSAKPPQFVPPAAQALLATAWQAQCDGRLEAAGEGYRQLLAQWPGWAEAHHRFGLWQYQCGQAEAALASMRHAVALAPERAEWHNDLGNLLAALGRDGEAAAAFIASLERDVHQAQVWSNLGAVLLRGERAEDALTAFEKAVALDGARADAWRNLAAAHTALGHVLEAARCECQAYVLPPYDDKPYQMLATSFYVLGRIDEAAEVYRQWLRIEPAHPIAVHMLAACTVENVPPRASDAYLEQYFDQASALFDSKMCDTLAYRIPALMGEALAKLALPAGGLSVLDAGCGTGLCGPYLQPWARTLTGVDLSPKSLALAADKQCYHHLAQEEIVAHLQCHVAAYDLIASADTFIYFGALAPFLRAAAGALTPGGWLVASVEERFADGPFGITPSGRYNHRQDYLRAELAASGFTLMALHQVPVRVELGQPVPGLLLLARKALPTA
ncbi:MAG: tetratricopeptide repeat protein [Paludibacterium sp.]|uniref:methyltransferase domain-containing protein n=1 Tax=Paludibacterium sp. TaxID=1917523 RepID=UPI0025CFD239|nr:tetratricopeptide repeat protein [Paludibacterium sp.]MBV8048846.1 tetratricopeptide repeat protein [Paludibacterium sp.]MBV8646497.1 tetratricopeptide repeat protein [Paludibacterium sp.]